MLPNPRQQSPNTFHYNKGIIRSDETSPSQYRGNVSPVHEPSTVYTASRLRAGRPQSTSLEIVAVVNGILEAPSSSHPIVERIRAVLLSRGIDGFGFSELQRRMNVLDRDGSRTLSLEQFKIVVQKCDLGLGEKDIYTLFDVFDASNRGSYIDIDHFLCVLRGVVSAQRRELIKRAFLLLDVNEDGLLDPARVIEQYDPTQHPDVKNGRKRAQDVFRSFLKTFEVGGEVENKITRNEFYNYYYNLCATIDDDEYFSMIICGAWHLDPESVDTKHRVVDRLNDNYRESSTGSQQIPRNPIAPVENNSQSKAEKSKNATQYIREAKNDTEEVFQQSVSSGSFDYSEYRQQRNRSPMSPNNFSPYKSKSKFESAEHNEYHTHDHHDRLRSKENSFDNRTTSYRDYRFTSATPDKYY